MTAFKIRNAGRLPEELQSNLQMQNSYQQQLGAVQEVLNRNQQDKMILETSLQNLKSQMSMIDIAPESSETVVTKAKTDTRNERLAAAEKRVEVGEAELEAMKERLKPTHPDLRAAMKRMEAIRQERDKIAAQVNAEQEMQDKIASSQPAPAPPKRAVNPDCVENSGRNRSPDKDHQARIRGLDLDSEERVRMQKGLFDQLKVAPTGFNLTPHAGRICPVDARLHPG